MQHLAEELTVEFMEGKRATQQLAQGPSQQISNHHGRHQKGGSARFGEAAIRIKHTTPAANAANPCVEIVRGEERSLALTVKLK